jgi:hypothetical protein
MKTKIHWYCSTCTKEFEGSEPDTHIEFFINKQTDDPEFQGQHQFYEAIESIGVCYQCCSEAMRKLGMYATIERLFKVKEAKTQ